MNAENQWIHNSGSGVDLPKEVLTRTEGTVPEEALARSRFLVSMGHTLRSPLNSILGFTDMLLEEVSGPLTERQRRHLLQIVGAGERQLEIIDNLICLARLHAGDATFEPKPVRVHPLLERAVGRFRVRAESAAVTLLLEVEPDLGWLVVDSAGVERAIGNLLSNSIRNSEPGDVVRVAAGHRKVDETSPSPITEAVSICVADSGAGIDPSLRPSLFEDLEESCSFEARRTQRFGTGLPLARRLLEREGGRISLETGGGRGEGARFLILLPHYAKVPDETGHRPPGAMSTTGNGSGEGRPTW